MTLKQAKEGFINYCEFEKKLSGKTIQAYQIDLKQFGQFLVQHRYETDIETIDKHILRHYLKDIATFKSRTIKRKVATLKALFNFLEFEDEIAINPFRKIRIKIKSPRELPQVMNKSEVREVFKAAYSSFDRNQSGSGYRYYTKARDIAILELLFTTGIRVSELCSLKKDCIDTDSGRLLIRGKGGKERIIQVCNPEALDILRLFRQLDDKRGNPTVFFFINRRGRKLSDQSVRNMIKKYSRQASISKAITPHTFRHTFATLLLEEGVDITYIQHFLGHSSVSTTQIYTHVNGSKQKEILATKHPRNRFAFSSS